MEYVRRTSRNINSNYLINLLDDRGILPKSEEDRQNFFKPSKDNLEDPLLLDNIEEGCELLLTHIKNDNKICLVVD